MPRVPHLLGSLVPLPGAAHRTSYRVEGLAYLEPPVEPVITGPAVEVHGGKELLAQELLTVRHAGEHLPKELKRINLHENY